MRVRRICCSALLQRERDMTRSGGSIALNGFLYQILNHLHWLADVSLTGTLDGQEVKDGCLVLEPGKGGGDAQAHASGLYLVEQYKTRASGTWSLSDVITVLRDLRKSVPGRPSGMCSIPICDEWTPRADWRSSRSSLLAWMRLKARMSSTTT